MNSREMELNWKLFEEDYVTKPEIKKRFLKLCDRFVCLVEKERNDVFIYKTLRYPPKSTPPTAN